MILLWLSSVPVFHCDETWRDGRAIQAKLDHLILSSCADNRYVGVEHLDEAELRRLSQRLVELAGTTPDESPLDEAIVDMVTDEKAKNMAKAAE